MTPQDRGVALAKAADDRMRTAHRALAKALRELAREADDLANGLLMASPRDRITSRVPARYTAYRNAVDHLEAERAGAALMREEASRLVQSRSA